MNLPADFMAGTLEEVSAFRRVVLVVAVAKFILAALEIFLPLVEKLASLARSSAPLSRRAQELGVVVGRHRAGRRCSGSALPGRQGNPLSGAAFGRPARNQAIGPTSGNSRMIITQTSRGQGADVLLLGGQAADQSQHREDELRRGRDRWTTGPCRNDGAPRTTPTTTTRSVPASRSPVRGQPRRTRRRPTAYQDRPTRAGVRSGRARPAPAHHARRPRRARADQPTRAAAASTTPTHSVLDGEPGR